MKLTSTDPEQELLVQNVIDAQRYIADHRELWRGWAKAERKNIRQIASFQDAERRLKDAESALVDYMVRKAVAK